MIKENEAERKVFLHILALALELGSISSRDAAVVEDILSGMPVEDLCKKHKMAHGYMRQIFSKELRVLRGFSGNLGQKFAELKKENAELKAEVSMLNQMKADLRAENYALRKDLSIYRKVETTYSDDNYSKKLFALLLHNMGFNQTVSNIFHQDGLVNAGQLLAYTEGDLLKFRNFGQKCLDDVREVLDKHNLKLRK